MSRSSLYSIKSRFVDALDPLVAGLASRRVSPTLVTLSAVPVAAAIALALIGGQHQAALWITVHPLALLLMAINAIDGALARRTGRESATGAVLNELVDRLGDLLLIGSAFALVPWEVATAALVTVLVSEVVALIGWGAVGSRALVGVFGKPDRALWLSVGAAAALIVGPGVLEYAFGAIALGAGITAVQRIQWVLALAGALDAGNADAG